MFLSIIHNRSGEQVVLRRLGPNENIDPEHHAKKYCALYDLEIEEPNGYIFEGEYTAETRNTKKYTGSCWSSFEFFTKHQDF